MGADSIVEDMKIVRQEIKNTKDKIHDLMIDLENLVSEKIEIATLNRR